MSKSATSDKADGRSITSASSSWVPSQFKPVYPDLRDASKKRGGFGGFGTQDGLGERAGVDERAGEHAGERAGERAGAGASAVAGPSPNAGPSAVASPNAPALASERTRSRKPRKKRNVREYTLGEEIANSITHGIGAALAIAALVLLIVRAVSDGAGVYLFAALVYGIAMLVEYLMSTLYHAIAHDGAKRVFKVLDHSCIYLLIAGTYTPYCLITLGDVGGVWLAAFVWVVAVVGIACEAFWTFRPRWISAVIYVLMGWCVVAFLPQLFELLPTAGFWLLAAGGISYTVGAVFYILKKVPYMHSVFHLFVLAGSILQFLSVILYVL